MTLETVYRLCFLKSTSYSNENCVFQHKKLKHYDKSRSSTTNNDSMTTNCCESKKMPLKKTCCSYVNSTTASRKLRAALHSDVSDDFVR